jgi:biotin transporter BioY
MIGEADLLKSKFLSGAKGFLVCLLFSWCYAVVAQISVFMPFNMVPLTLQHVALFLLAHFFGIVASVAFLQYFAQVALGAPFWLDSKGARL